MSVISDKFKKEMIKFFEWVEHANYTVSKGDDECEWSLNLAPAYTEPGRYKLIVFIEEILKNYNINLDDTKIIDAKQMATNFKNYKPVKEKKTSPKKEKKTSPKKESLKKESPKTEENTQLLVNNITLDTSCNGMLSELELTTKELENIFGCKAVFTGNQFTDHRYEWKFTFNNIIYSIYDWAYDDNTFDEYIDNEWFLGGDSDSEIKLVKELLNTQLRNTKSEAFVYDTDDELETSNVLVL
jgi:hypothetical protein